jgi:hypothetical protein
MFTRTSRFYCNHHQILLERLEYYLPTSLGISRESRSFGRSTVHLPALAGAHHPQLLNAA